PRVFWLNSQGNQITAESTNSAKGSDGLYTVSSTVTVNKRQTYSLTCRVQQKNINQTEEAHIHVSEISIHDEDENELHQTEMEEKLQKECEENLKRLEEELQNNEDDLKHVRQTIEKLMEQKTSLKKQSEKLNTLLQEDKAGMKEITKKETETQLLDKEKKKNKREDKKIDLEIRIEVHDGLLKMTEKLMEETENIIIQMTERKGELEKDKEQIIKHLREK
ncbi:synaptonemal complex protein 1-like, partial [Neolamprologus brichardi]|uniref:synaptonemal complex protein 1-like n=1 Tax=Neolamprologus brichardi TaxID=32507 RepID=UPI001643A664